MKILFAVMLLAGSLAAQQRTVNLTWQHPQDPPAVTFNMYRAEGACTPRPTAWTKLNAAPISAKSYADSNVAVGKYCYYATALWTDLESVPSNDAYAAVAPVAPSGLSVTVAIAEITVSAGGELNARLEVKTPSKD